MQQPKKSSISQQLQGPVSKVSILFHTGILNFLSLKLTSLINFVVNRSISREPLLEIQPFS